MVNENNIFIPDWLTTDFLQNLLQKHRSNNELMVQSFVSTPAVNKGENYSSDLIRVRVCFTSANCASDHCNLIIKLKLATGGDFSAVVEEMNSFNVEIDAYSNVLPKVHELLRSIGDDYQLVSE